MPQKHNIDQEFQNCFLSNQKLQIQSDANLSHKNMVNFLVATWCKTQDEMFQISITMTGFCEKC